METDTQAPILPARLTIVSGGYAHQIHFNDVRNAETIAKDLNERIEKHWELTTESSLYEVFEFTNPITGKRVGVRVTEVSGYEIELI